MLVRMLLIVLSFSHFVLPAAALGAGIAVRLWRKYAWCKKREYLLPQMQRSPYQ